MFACTLLTEGAGVGTNVLALALPADVEDERNGRISTATSDVLVAGSVVAEGDMIGCHGGDDGDDDLDCFPMGDETAGDELFCEKYMR